MPSPLGGRKKKNNILSKKNKNEAKQEQRLFRCTTNTSMFQFSFSHFIPTISQPLPLSILPLSSTHFQFTLFLSTKRAFFFHLFGGGGYQSGIKIVVGKKTQKNNANINNNNNSFPDTAAWAFNLSACFYFSCSTKPEFFVSVLFFCFLPVKMTFFAALHPLTHLCMSSHISNNHFNRAMRAGKNGNSRCVLFNAALLGGEREKERSHHKRRTNQKKTKQHTNRWSCTKKQTNTQIKHANSNNNHITNNTNLTTITPTMHPAHKYVIPHPSLSHNAMAFSNISNNCFHKAPPR